MVGFVRWIGSLNEARGRSYAVNDTVWWSFSGESARRRCLTAPSRGSVCGVIKGMDKTVMTGLQEGKMLSNHNLMFREGLYFHLQCVSEHSSIASNHLRPNVSTSFSVFRCLCLEFQAQS
jgi:hypothetical protein